MLDANQYNKLAATTKDNIPTDCAAYERTRDKSKFATSILGATTFSLSDYEAYRNDIEFVNAFNEQLFVDEKNYFEKKYGVKVYKYLLTQRAAYKEQQAKRKEDALCGSYKAKLRELQGKIDKHDACKEGGLDGTTKMLDYLLSQSPIQNPDTTYRKIEYRNEAHEWISTLNLWSTILYFAIFFVMLGLLATSNKLFLGQRFMLYLFLAVLPFAFPYFYQLLKYLYGYVFPESPSHGPKNAFGDIQQKPNIDSFNM